MQKGFAPILVLLGVLVIAAIGGVYYFGKPLIKPASNLAPTPVLWGKFISNRNNYEVEYPLKWIVEEATELPAISFLSPDAKRNDSGTIIEGIDITIFSNPNPKRFTPIQWLKSQEEASPLHGPPSYEDMQEITIAGASALKYFATDIVGIEGRAIMVVITYHDKAYHIVASHGPAREEEALQIVEHILRSWKFLY